MKALEFTKALYKIARYGLLELPLFDAAKQESIDSDVLNSIKSRGFVVIENFYTDEKCWKIKNEIDTLLQKYDHRLWRDDKGADKRLFGANNKSTLIDEFFKDDFINQIRKTYYQRNGTKGFAMASKIDAIAANKGSGGGWHRDSIYATQLKAIIYICDVEHYNGPFQYVSGTHTSSSKLAAIRNVGLGAQQNRLTPELVTRVIDSGHFELHTLTAKKGTLIIADTSGIHRGQPLSEGSRYALTNYWFPQKIPVHIAKLVVK